MKLILTTKKNSRGSSDVVSAGSASKKENSNGHCSSCGEILQGMLFMPQLKLAHVCYNIHCNLYRSPQYYTNVPSNQVPRKKSAFAYRSPARCIYLAEKRENYHLLTSLGLTSVEASNRCTRKQTKIYLESIGYERDK